MTLFSTTASSSSAQPGIKNAHPAVYLPIKGIQRHGIFQMRLTATRTRNPHRLKAHSIGYTSLRTLYDDPSLGSFGFSVGIAVIDAVTRVTSPRSYETTQLKD